MSLTKGMPCQPPWAYQGVSDLEMSSHQTLVSQRLRNSNGYGHGQKGNTSSSAAFQAGLEPLSLLDNVDPLRCIKPHRQRSSALGITQDTLLHPLTHPLILHWPLWLLSPLKSLRMQSVGARAPCMIFAGPGKRKLASQLHLHVKFCTHRSSPDLSV